MKEFEGISLPLGEGDKNFGKYLHRKGTSNYKFRLIPQKSHELGNDGKHEGRAVDSPTQGYRALPQALNDPIGTKKLPFHNMGRRHALGPLAGISLINYRSDSDTER